MKLVERAKFRERTRKRDALRLLRALVVAAPTGTVGLGPLGEHVMDWHIVESSIAKLDHALVGEYPGAGDYAVLKVHKRVSVGLGTTTTIT